MERLRLQEKEERKKKEKEQKREKKKKERGGLCTFMHINCTATTSDQFYFKAYLKEVYD